MVLLRAGFDTGSYGFCLAAVHHFEEGMTP
jgi:hypothetical protein